MKVPPFRPPPARWETIQQFVRIAIFGLAGWLFGEDWADNEMVSQGVAGAVALVNLIWWAVWETKRPSSAADPVPEAHPDPAPKTGQTTTVTTKTEKTPADKPATKPKEPKP